VQRGHRAPFRTLPQLQLQRRNLLRGEAAALSTGVIGIQARPLPLLARDAPDLTSRTIEVSLEARSTVVEVAGRQVQLLTYNGRFPGPLIRAREGDLLRVALVNRLDEPTNLHFHGLHVPPGGNGDNVFVEVPPGGRFVHELVVPAGHGGTFWYHPHRHHRLARQLWHGLAGPLVIDPLREEPPELAAADERIVVVKDLSVGPDGLPAPHTTGDWARGKTGRLLLVNGAERPAIAARSSLVRLRLINACNARFLRLARADGRPCELIAHEGRPLEAPRRLPELVVAPAQRVDLLLGLEPGEPLTLLAKPYNSGARRDPPSPQPLLTLSPPAAHRPVPLPARLAEVERLDPGSAAVRRTFRMAMAFLTPDGHGHLEPIRARLGDLELWEITNVDTQDHVFHLHTWPFQVWRRDGREPPYRAWRDTINLTPGERVELLIPFRRFAGRSVFHCHVAEHGDAGMMGIVEVAA
jgi:FtsP/CotA-like multicopper oxidase with cupredoxin domain